MTVNIAPAKDSPTGPSMPSAPAASGASAATGYRISILPAALEISARLATAEELQTLVKILQGHAIIWANATMGERQPVALETAPITSE